MMLRILSYGALLNAFVAVTVIRNDPSVHLNTKVTHYFTNYSSCKEIML